MTTLGNVLGGALSDRAGREWVFTAGRAVAVIGIAGFGALRGPDDVLLLAIYVASGLGGFIGPFLGGYLFDLTGVPGGRTVRSWSAAREAGKTAAARAG